MVMFSIKVKVWTLAIAPLTWVRLVTSSALQSRKWQLTGMGQWCHSALCGYPMPTLLDSQTYGAACRHTTAPISHTRPLPRSPQQVRIGCAVVERWSLTGEHVCVCCQLCRSEKRCSATPRGRATPWTYKKGVATPWMCNQSLIKPSGFYSIRCSTFTQTPKRSKEIDPPLSVKCLLKRKRTKMIKTVDCITKH